MKIPHFISTCLAMLTMALSCQATQVLFTMQSLTGQNNNRQILVQPDRPQNPLVIGTNLIPLYDFTLQPVAGQVQTNLEPWGYTIKVDGWPRSAHIVVTNSSDVLNVATLINTNAFAPIILQITQTGGSATTNASLLTTGTVADSLLSAAVQASLARANAALTNGNAFDAAGTAASESNKATNNFTADMLQAGTIPDARLKIGYVSAFPQTNFTALAPYEAFPRMDLGIDGKTIYKNWYSSTNHTGTSSIQFARSDNGGLTWTTPWLVVSNNNISSRSCDYGIMPSGLHVLAVGQYSMAALSWTNSYIVTSTDATNWTQRASINPPTSFSYFAPASDGIIQDASGRIHAPMYAGVTAYTTSLWDWYSDDAGITWQTNLVFASTNGDTEPSMATQGSDIALVSRRIQTHDAGGTKDLFWSTNYGASWFEVGRITGPGVTTNITYSTPAQIKFFNSGQGTYLGMLWGNREDGNIYFGSALVSDVLKSPSILATNAYVVGIAGGGGYVHGVQLSPSGDILATYYYSTNIYDKSNAVLHSIRFSPRLGGTNIQAAALVGTIPTANIPAIPDSRLSANVAMLSNVLVSLTISGGSITFTTNSSGITGAIIVTGGGSPTNFDSIWAVNGYFTNGYFGNIYMNSNGASMMYGYDTNRNLTIFMDGTNRVFWISNSVTHAYTQITPDWIDTPGIFHGSSTAWIDAGSATLYGSNNSSYIDPNLGKINYQKSASPLGTLDLSVGSWNEGTFLNVSNGTWMDISGLAGLDIVNKLLTYSTGNYTSVDWYGHTLQHHTYVPSTQVTDLNWENHTFGGNWDASGLMATNAPTDTNGVVSASTVHGMISREASVGSGTVTNYIRYMGSEGSSSPRFYAPWYINAAGTFGTTWPTFGNIAMYKAPPGRYVIGKFMTCQVGSGTNSWFSVYTNGVITSMTNNIVPSDSGFYSTNDVTHPFTLTGETNIIAVQFGYFPYNNSGGSSVLDLGYIPE